MGKQIFSFKGMMRDLSVSKNPSNYAYEIRNMRLTAQEDSTLLSLVTEKGNREFAIKDSSGNPVTLDNIIGYCTVGKYLTVFTHGSTDSIVRLEEIKTATPSYMEAKVLYQGDLNFEDNDGKVVEIDSLGCYENENIQKVYWVDGVNQPRLINITANDDEISNWSGMETPFDFIPALGFNETVGIKKVNYNGLFAPGTLQYVLTYYKLNGQQSNSFYDSELFYTSYSNRGASPEDSVSNAFEIKVYNPDTSFDFIRIYSMLRTSQDDAPVCKRVYDIPIENLSYEFRIWAYEFTSSSSAVLQDEQSEVSTFENVFVAKLRTGSTYRTQDIENYCTGIVNGYKQYIIPADETSDIILLVIDNNVRIDAQNITGYIYTVDEGYSIKLTQTASGCEFLPIDSSLETSSLYSLHVTQCTFVKNGVGDDIPYVSVIDNGMFGESCDLSEILYAGGQIFTPKTLAQKNNTLFFANYNISSFKFSRENQNIIRNATRVYFGYSDNEVPKGTLGSYYMYSCQLDLSSKEITTFKGGESYLLGLTFQDKMGVWSEVVPLSRELNTVYVHDTSTSFKPVKAYIFIDFSTIGDILDNFVNVRVVRADIPNNVLCQGVLCPTVFDKNRENNNPYAQASWYFRDVRSVSLSDNRPQALNFHNIRNNYDTNEGSVLSGEIQYAENTDDWYYSHAGNYDLISEYNKYVDWNLVTLNSPDIDFSTLKLENTQMRIVGLLPMTGSVSSRMISFQTTPFDWNLMRVDRPEIMSVNESTDGYKIELCNYNYYDKRVSTDTSVSSMPIYPWHRDVSIHCEGAEPSQGWHSTISTKIMASLRTSSKTLFVTDKPIFKLGDIKLYNSIDNLPVLLNSNGTLIEYQGSVDSILVNQYAKYNYYKDSLDIIHYNSSDPSSDMATEVSMRYRSGNHAVMQLLSESNTTLELLPNVYIDSLETQIPINVESASDLYNTVKLIDIGTITGVTPFECTAFSMVDWNTYLGSHRYSMVTHSFMTLDISSEYPTIVKGDNTGLKDNMFSSTVENIIDTNNLQDGEIVIIKYNTDKLLLCKVIIDSTSKTIRPIKYYTDIWNDYYTDVEYLGVWGAKVIPYDNTDKKLDGTIYQYKLKYKAKYFDGGNVTYVTFSYDIYKYEYSAYVWEIGSHGYEWKARFNGTKNIMYILSTTASSYISETSSVVRTYVTTHSPSLSVPSGITSGMAYMYLADLYIKNNVEDNDSTYYNSDWIPASLSFPITNNYIPVELGDTYYQRYDCLKTYSYSQEDTNQIIEIFSFMCETRINIDGRYDIFRGLNDNTIVTNEKFNTINMSYTQKDNLKSYHYIEPELFENDYFPNQVAWSLSKTPNSKIDSWTNIELTSVLDMDGTLGPVSTLRLFNDNLLCWQSKGFARIQYNDRNAISTSSGVPVELANSGKVDGKTYISTEHGCDNMNTVQITPSGVYFTDSNTRDLMKYGQDGLFSLSKAKGFNSYMNHVANLNASKTFYDPKLQDVYFKTKDYNNDSYLTGIPDVFYYDRYGYINGDYHDKAVYTHNTIEINNVEYCIYDKYDCHGDGTYYRDDYTSNQDFVSIFVPKSFWNRYTTYELSNNPENCMFFYYAVEDSHFNYINTNISRHQYLISVEGPDVTVVDTRDECLLFNEQLNEFTSFMDYNMDFLLPLQDSIITIKGNSLYKQFDGDYLTFFGSVKDYSIEFIANENPLVDKIFTNLEFRADVINPNTGGLVGTSSTTANSANELPFSKIRVWNEYQDTEDTPLEQMIRRGVNMSQRFRIWRCDIPRDSTKKLDRIRNMWAKVKLSNTGKAFKTVLHDVNIIYYQ